MTSPTPDLDYATIWEAGRADGYEAGRDEYAKALTAVTAERDEARQMLADAPHHGFCSSLYSPHWSCTCWKDGR